MKTVRNNNVRNIFNALQITVYTHGRNCYLISVGLVLTRPIHNSEFTLLGVYVFLS